jgi:hypothetical protein
MILGCTSTAWSAVASAPANTTLAGVLAGFMINGVVLLLSTTPGSNQRSGYVQGAGLLFTALVTLGLDAYLFGLVTGDTAAQACRRAWTEAMFAAGLLGLGAVAVIVAIVFLLGVFFYEAKAAVELAQNKPSPVPSPLPSSAGTTQVSFDDEAAKEKAPADGKTELDNSKEMLATLCILLRPGVAVIMISLLWVTARSYLFSIFDDRPPNWAVTMLDVILAVEYIVVVIFIAVYWLTSRPGSGKPDPSHVLRSSVLKRLVKLVWEGLQPDERGETKTLKIALFTASGYSLLSSLFAALVVYSPATLWNSSRGFVDFVFVATASWVLIVALVPLAALLAPTFGPRRAPA